MLILILSELRVGSILLGRIAGFRSMPARRVPRSSQRPVANRSSQFSLQPPSSWDYLPSAARCCGMCRRPRSAASCCSSRCGLSASIRSLQSTGSRSANRLGHCDRSRDYCPSHRTGRCDRDHAIAAPRHLEHHSRPRHGVRTGARHLDLVAVQPTHSRRNRTSCRRRRLSGALIVPQRLSFPARRDGVGVFPGVQAHLIVLEATGIVEIDFTAAQILSDTIKACHSLGIGFAIARLEFRVRPGSDREIRRRRIAREQPPIP